MTEFQILSAVKNSNGSMEFTALLNLNVTDTHRDFSADEARIGQMIGDKLLKGRAEANCLISITKEGSLFLQNAYHLEEQKKKLAEKAAKKEADKKRHDWGLAIGSAFIAGFIGLAFELIAFFFLK